MSIYIMDIESFNNLLKTVMKDVSINSKNLQLNGSFNSSLWASDIDLYEPVKGKTTKVLLQKLEDIYFKYDVLEIKVVLPRVSQKYKRVPKSIKSTVVMVKVDLILQDVTPFPIECSIIYDFYPENTYDVDKFLEGMLEDLKKKKYSLFKKVKRCNSVGSLFGFDHLFDDITENTKLGMLNLSIERLLTMDNGKKYISEEDYDKYYQWIQEDLRKYGFDIKKDNLKSKLDSLVLEKLKNIMSSNGISL